MSAPSRCQPVASHAVQVQNRTAPSLIEIPTDMVSAEPHVEQVVCTGPRVVFMSLFSAAGKLPPHGPVGPFLLVRTG
jgi:hypothetical protein